ncbi:GlyGly-CTERM sorting domain-containing protein [Photobacterium leiognathi subsp. mandapamensis]|uniref:DUF3466 family protein n=1 Tax=Photobacterium leiognathi TaxID=553611 RepID=UPI000D1701E9|nr:DUF3466 family protein [Photobacterium leiognathi]PSU96418.1 GlyGly-CTERM sorting domain-containing protein [Photobacterium leiognathi subsp. mandapamensis]
MPHKMLKLSTLAILVAGASQASAAVYTIEPVSTAGADKLAAQEYFPSAQANADSTPVSMFTTGIKPSAEGENCFTGNCNAGSYDVAGTARRGTQGAPLSDAVAFNQNRQFVNDLSGLYNYCRDDLGYNTCDVWARSEYFGYGYNVDDEQSGQGLGGLQHIQQTWKNNYRSNAVALDNGAAVTTKADDVSAYPEQGIGTLQDKTTDATLEGITGNYSFGTSSSAVFNNNGVYPRAFAKRGFVNIDGTPAALLNPVSGDAFVKNMGQTMANGAVETTDGNLLVVGTSSFAQTFTQDVDSRDPNTDDINIGLGFNKDTFKQCATNPSNLYSTFECQFSSFANEAAFWLVDASGNVVKSGAMGSNLAAVDKDHDDVSAQASANAVAMVNGSPVAVGYISRDTNSSDSYVMEAAFFKPTAGIDSSWTQTAIPGITISTGDDRNYEYTMANDVNANFKVVGIAKSHKADNRSYPQKMFIYDNATGQTKFLDSSVSSIFFRGANGDAEAINDHDQVVGWIDSETKNQIDGSERRHRAFTYIAGSAAQGPLKAGSVWMLDDLTNDPELGNASVANSYRIISATDVNNAGVISATANYCAGGYQNLTKEAQCSVTEKQVAIKLVPKANATDKDIIVRKAEEDEPVKRSGGSLGILALTALGFIGFRRRK